MKYDIILFDADETLFDFNRSEYNALKIAFEKNGLPFSDEIYEEYHLINKSLWEMFELGRIDKPSLVIERFRRLMGAHGFSPDPTEFNSTYVDALSRQSILFPGAAELCKELSAEARLYIVTNGTKITQIRRYGASPLPQYIDDIFISEEIGAQKPSKDYFDAVFAKIPDFDRSRAIIIGDSLSSDIKGGAAAQIDTCWYNPWLLPNKSGTTPTYTAKSYDDIRAIVRGKTGRPLPCDSPVKTCRHEHTNRRALVLLPADDGLKDRFRAAAPDFEFIFEDPANTEKVGEFSASCEVVIGSAPLSSLQASDSLRFVQLCMAGTEPYALPGALPDGVTITNATGAFGLAVSEHMFAALLCLYKKLHLYRDNMREGAWLDRGEVKTLKGATVLTVGLGDIGESFARMASALGAYTIGVRRTDTEKPDFLDELVLSDSLDEVLPRADIVAMVLPNTAQTKGIMTRERIFSMKKGAILLNAGRGNAIDTDALCDALECGHLSGASVDVTDPEPLPSDHRLWKCENALITPHVSGFYHLKNTYLSIADICVDNIYRYSHGLMLKNIVDRQTGYTKK